MIDLMKKDKQQFELLKNLFKSDKERTLLLLDNLFSSESARFQISEYDVYKNDMQFALSASDLMEEAAKAKYSKKFKPVLNSINAAVAWVKSYSHNEDNLKSSFRVFETIHNEEPNNAYVVFGMGYCKIWLGQIKEANEIFVEYEKIIENNPKQLEINAWWHRAYCCLRLDNFEDAKKYFRKFVEARAVAKGSQSFILDGISYLGYASAKTNDLDLADKSFDQVLLEDKWNFGATIGKELVSQKRSFYEEKKKLVESTKTYLEKLFKEIPSGLNNVARMYIIQFAIGVFFILMAIILAAFGVNTLVSGISGLAGTSITIVSLINKAPVDLQKNRVNSGQWMMAYYNWINALYMVSSAIDQLPKDSEEIQKLQNYLTKVTTDTIMTMNVYCASSENHQENKQPNDKKDAN
jgi:tetratricopeptide (TPR) repeat protein